MSTKSTKQKKVTFFVDEDDHTDTSKETETSPVPKTTIQEKLNPKTKSYEFGGPIGALGMVVILPCVVLFFTVSCDATGYPSQVFKEDWKSLIFSEKFLNSILDPSALFVYIGYMSLLAFFYVDLPAEIVMGTRLRDGSKHKYRLNGKPQ